MRLSAKTFAAMLMGLALAAYPFDMDAQSRGSRPSSSSSVSRQSSGSSYSRSSGSSNREATRPSGTATRPSTSSTRPSGTTTRPSGSTARPSSTTTRPSAGPTRPTVKPEGGPRPDVSPTDRNPSRPSAGKPSGCPQPQKPGQVHPPSHNPRPPKVHPRDRDFMHYNKPSYHWAPTHHYYGYRVRTLPVHVHRHIYRGITYYLYDNIWYRPYNGYYVVCRPPFGTSLAANLIADIAWTAVRLSYYNTVANTYSQINDNNAYIAQQNEVIAQNNATIAAQNQMIAQSQLKAQAAYGLANSLGLVQSYAAAGTSYFYQDGVFYAQAADGQYYVIVPPAGALVEALPEDFDMVTLDGKEYYKVDDTIYQVTISDGKPYFEVLGQMS